MKNKPPIIHLVKSSVSGSQNPLSPDGSSSSLQQRLDNMSMKENQLELAAEVAGFGLWSLDLSTNVFCINNAIRELFEFPENTEINIELFTDKVHPEDLPAVKQAMHRMLEGERKTSIEYRIILSDGSIRWIHSRGGLYSYVGESSSCLTGASADITKRKLNEQAAARKLRFEALLSEISASFARFMLPSDVDDQIERALGRIMDYFGGDQCALIAVDLEKRKTNISHAFFGEGLERVPPDTDLVSLFPWAFNNVLEGRCYCFADLDELPPEADVDRRSWMSMKVKSGLHVPLRVEDKVPYLIIVESHTRSISWSQETLNRLQILGEVFTNAIYKKRVEEELRKSYAEIAKLKDKLEVEADYLRAEVRAFRSHDEIVGQSEPLKRALALVEQVAPTSSTVLVFGETGTGKELIANAIHNNSPRQEKLMVKVNCASLPPSLIETELFGREKGAYTGALTSQMGRFELANGSTLFLDEISELSLELQSKLLRVLQEGEFERVGSPRTIKVNVRVIAATNRNLHEEVRKGKFREDLYYRLNVFPIVVPPLRERMEDIPMLVWEFVREFNEKMGRRINKIGKREMALLQTHSWPGNIRELRNVIEHAVIVSSGNELKVRLPENISEGPSSNMTLEEMEKRYIEDILKRTGWRIKGDGGAAHIIGMNPSTLYSRMKKLGISSQHENEGM